MQELDEKEDILAQVNLLQVTLPQGLHMDSISDSFNRNYECFTGLCNHILDMVLKNIIEAGM